MTRTKHPVVLIHGVFGYGTKRPLWNRWAPYWPQQALDDMRANYHVVDVGVLSSDHDRACEAFYQLYGGRVDYGEAHALEHGHGRYGYTHTTALHPQWSEQHPVHLVGHSFGATTAIELHQLICQDYFGVGSNHKWVTSVVSIAGPLSGTTLTHLFGLHNGKMVAYTLGHLIGASLCVWQRLLTQFPTLRGLFDYRMPQWEFVSTYREALSSTCRILASTDLAVYDILPARRLERNSRLVHMDKPYLVSIATSSHSQMPIIEVSLACLLLSALVMATSSVWIGEHHTALMTGVFVVVLSMWLLTRLRNLDYATLPCLTFLRVQMNLCVRFLHEIFDGFDRDEWEHNDGAVNVASMLTPMQLCKQDEDEDDEDEEDDTGDDSDTSGSDVGSTTSTVLSTVSSAAVRTSQPLLSTHKLHLDNYGGDSSRCPAGDKKKKTTLQRGRWYVHQLRKNHLAGTHYDRDAPLLFQQLLHLLATEMEN